MGLGFFRQAEATHLRAGVITVQSLGGRTYRFTIRLYLNFGPGVAEQNTIDFYPGDGISDQTRRSQLGLNDIKFSIPQQTIPDSPNNIVLNTWIIDYTYGGPGIYFPHIGTMGQDGRVENIPNRNAGILNIRNQSGSSEVPFYIETLLVVGTTINNTPLFLNPPIDQACSGTRFTYNPAAYDPDGDSLSYVLVTPWEAQNKVVGNGGYTLPNDSRFNGKSEAGGSPLFQINPITGTLTWDAPGATGQYNLAFLIEEWRNGERIGFERVDMQVVVNDCQNRRPEVIIPKDTCLVAGTLLNRTILARDPDVPLQDLRITSFGGVYDATFPNPRATFVFSPDKQKSTAKGTFNWQTACQHIRLAPYTIVFRAEDFPPNANTKLTDSKSWQVTIVGPQPTSLTATPLNKAIRLNWDNYLTKQCNNAQEIIIYRKQGCDNRTPANCEIGVPASWGYQEIGRVPAGTTTFLDDNNKAGLPKGIKYSYRIVASFPFPAGGLSYASDEVCISLIKDVPFMTNVSVEKTDKAAGQVFVRWTHPLEFNPGNFSGPYTYKLFRAEGINPAANVPFTEVYSQQVSAFPNFPRTALFTGGTAADTSFTDTNLNTTDKAYSYRVALYYGGNALTFKDSSATASSVRLAATPAPSSVSLNWSYAVPWNNAGQYHRIYRRINGQFIPIDSVLVNATGTGAYFDRGTYKNQPLRLDSTYCYFVETQGRYSDFELSVKVFRNKSQEACSTPKDTTKPCPPLLAVQTVNCNLLKADNAPCSDAPPAVKLENRLAWRNLFPAGCDKNIVSYKVYYKAYQDDSLQFLTAVPDTFLTHFNTINNVVSLAGCYAVTAINRSGNESRFSNIVCVDNCPYYVLPNLFTPENNDGKNDVFRPCPEPRFVQSVSFKVYNRWGKLVFEKNNDIFLNWSGKVGDGEINRTSLSTGIYYYSAEVRFIRLNRSDEIKRIKGYVEIVR